MLSINNGLTDVCVCVSLKGMYRVDSRCEEGCVSGGAREIEVRRGENMDRIRDYR